MGKFGARTWEVKGMGSRSLGIAQLQPQVGTETKAFLPTLSDMVIRIGEGSISAFSPPGQCIHLTKVPKSYMATWLGQEPERS